MVGQKCHLIHFVAFNLVMAVETVSDKYIVVSFPLRFASFVFFIAHKIQETQHAFTACGLNYLASFVELSIADNCSQ